MQVIHAFGIIVIAVIVAASLLVHAASQNDDDDGSLQNNETCALQKSVYVVIYSYDRPALLHQLLMDVERQASEKFRIVVIVIDDNSFDCIPVTPCNSNPFDSDSTDLFLTQLTPAAELSAPKLSCISRHRFVRAETVISRNAERGWRLYVSQYRHGRRRYWHLVRMAHEVLHEVVDSSIQQYFLFLPDDVRLSSSFFERATSAWDSIDHPRKLSLMLHIEKSRENVAVWTDLLPKQVTADLFRIGWVESGNFIADRTFLDFFNWSFPRVPISRWTKNPPISSGVGAVMSETIHGRRHRMYRTRHSLLAHVGTTVSKMNAAFRNRKEPMHPTLNFIDGEEAYKSLLRDASTVTASIASAWYREVSLHSVVHSLAPQVDHINVYLNGYDVVPPFLRATYITAVLSSETEAGDLGDIGKFHWANGLSSMYHLTADDDIVYPPDYVKMMLQSINEFVPPTVVGVHGIRLREEDLVPASGKRGKGYYGSREVLMATEEVSNFSVVHILGTGTMLYRVADVGHIAIDEVFPRPNMADVWFGILGQKRSLPFIVVPHKKGWIKEVPGTFDDSIYRRATRRKRADRFQTEAAISAVPWKLHVPTPRQQD